ncbi:Nucleoside diphosphate-linked moiety X motif 19, mitochondrial [Globodera pallida]|nr:Nucleoside diphosphate-linked moiety X motif 19, mitochondrial [Globodera pallida]
MLRRGPGAKFMPNSLVFPGGVLDESDLRFPREKTDFADGEVCGKRSPIRLGLDDDLALRVCAIRELFEEGGLLPVVEGDKPFLANAEGDVHLAEWRRKARDFLQFCKNMANPFPFINERFLPHAVVELANAFGLAFWPKARNSNQIIANVYFDGLTPPFSYFHWPRRNRQKLAIAPKKWLKQIGRSRRRLSEEMA